MTTIFAFKAKNAWVLVADRFATNNLYLEDRHVDRPYQSILTNVEDKILIHKDELIFAGCGNQERITDLAEEISMNCSTSEECKYYIKKKDAVNGFEGFKTDLPKLLIFLKSEQKGMLVNFEERDINKRITELTSFLILGGGERSMQKGMMQKDLIEESRTEISDKNSAQVAIRCAKLLDKIWLGLHKDDLKLTGPPCFIGCDICIMWDNKIQKIMVSPKDYEII